MDAPLTGPLTMESPLGNALTLHSMSGFEGLSEPFVYELDVLSSRSDIKASEILDKSVTVNLDLGDGQSNVRHWNGRVSEFQYVDTNDDGRSRYRLTLRPWFWQLTLSANCRVFQNMSVPAMVIQIFQDRNFTDYQNALTGTYAPHEYMLQYRESDFDFITRWLEREGIGYYFRHEDGKHTLVLTDSSTAYSSAAGCPSISYLPEDAQRDATMQYVRRWRATARVETGAYAHADYDFTKPAAPLYASRTSTDPEANSDLRLYDYPGGFHSYTEGEIAARMRLDQVRRDKLRFEGDTNARGLTVGSVFKLTGHPRADQNRKVVVATARVRLYAQQAQSTMATNEEPFDCAFTALDAGVTFRPPLSARRSPVRGPQSATVVGPGDKEIWTDVYGRIRVQFHWDRQGTRDERSSCWIRVAQVWAGTGWGAQFIPRIGQEVLVDFLDGDPDRPIVTGSVYNDGAMPPFVLPGHETRSGFRTRSTPGGSLANCNEIRFEDSIGNEDLFIQAEKTQTTLVKGDQTIGIGANRALTVAGHENVTVKSGRTTDVTPFDSTTVTGVSNLTVQGMRNVAVTADENHTVTGAQILAVTATQNVHIFGDRTEAVDGRWDATTAGVHKETFDADFIAKHKAHRIISVGDGNTPASSSVHVEGAATGYVADTLELTVVKGITVTCGSSQIVVTPNGVTITAQSIALTSTKDSTFAGDTIALASAKDMKLAGDTIALAAASSAKIGGQTVTLTSSGATVALDSNAAVQGTQVKLGSGSGSSGQNSSAQTTPPKTTTIVLNDPSGKPLANQAVILRYGGDSGTQKTIVLDGRGQATVTGNDAFDVIFPEVGDVAQS